MPGGAKTLLRGLRMVAEVFHTLKTVLKRAGHNTNVGDEGGFAPNLDNEEAIRSILDAVDKAGHRRPRQGLRHRAGPGAPELFDEGAATSSEVGPGKISRASEMIDLSRRLGGQVPDRLDRGPARPGRLGRLRRAHRAARRQGADRRRRLLRHQHRAPRPRASPRASRNSILVKVNQIGTLTETLDAIELARARRLHAVISHRSGETEDATIADIAVATNAGQIKTGAPSAPTGSPSTTSSSASRKSWAATAVYPGRDAFPRCQP